MKAGIKSSGTAAPVAQTHHTGGLDRSFPAFSDDLKNGANNFKLLLDRLLEISEETVWQFGETCDGRDYRRMSFELETAILANLLGDSEAVREGFLRAMTDMFAHHVDGASPSVAWDPLTTTAAAYARQGEAA